MSTRKDAPEPASALGEAYDKVSGTVVTAYATAREKAAEATDGIDASPMTAVLGGLALGAIAGVLIPAIARERELLAPVGGRIAGAAKSAIEAAKVAGSDALNDGGVTTDALREQASGLFAQVMKAAAAAGSAAVQAARKA